MTESGTQQSAEATLTRKRTRSQRLYIQNRQLLAWTLAYSLLGAVLYVLMSLIPMPYTMISLFKFGIVPATAIIAVAGAIRGPIAGFLTGYLGTIVYDLIAAGQIITLTLPAAAWGILGLIVGLFSYDFTRGRSLAKLGVISVVANLATTLVLLLVGLRIEVFPTLAIIVFFMIPMLTAGIPSIFLLSPIYARIWQAFMMKVRPSQLVT
jgi:energy-coupling factor transport system substrate-specific component